MRKGPEGIFDWIKERASDAAAGVFNTLMAPVRAVAGGGAKLSEQFMPLVATLQDAATKIASNDCSPLQQAAAKIEHIAEQIITPVIEFVQPIIAKIQEFVGLVWQKVGAPIWEWIQQYASQRWQEIKQLASWIWESCGSRCGGPEQRSMGMVKETNRHRRRSRGRKRHPSMASRQTSGRLGLGEAAAGALQQAVGGYQGRSSSKPLKSYRRRVRRARYLPSLPKRQAASAGSKITSVTAMRSSRRVSISKKCSFRRSLGL